MGRPPLGKRAMSGAERMRRHRRHRRKTFRHVTKQASVAAQAGEIARLEARIRELEAELADLAEATAGTFAAGVTPQWAATLYDLLSAYAAVRRLTAASEDKGALH